MLGKLWRSSPVQRALGSLLAGYLTFLRRTTTFRLDPPDAYAPVDANWPVIATIWHGQHFMMPFARRDQDRFKALISSHGDGELNAIACEKLGIGLVRGSGAQHAYQVRKRGGAKALRAMLDALNEGSSIVSTADVPKVSRVAGMGVISLARMSGRPILPVAVVVKNRIDFPSWDRASLGLPLFNRGVIAFGPLVWVPADSSEEAIETLRQELQNQLDLVHARAYALLGISDPGANRESVRIAREVEEQANMARSKTRTPRDVPADKPDI